MQSILGALGFGQSNIRETAQLVERLCAGATQWLGAGDGAYGCRNANAGAQLWAQWSVPRAAGDGGRAPNLQPADRGENRGQAIRRERELTGVLPYHVTDCRIPMRIEKNARRACDLNRLDGGLTAVSLPGAAGQAEATGEIAQITFDVTAFALHQRRRLPFMADVALIGLAYGVKPAADIALGAARPAADYLAERTGRHDFAPALPTSLRSLTGTVVSMRALTNDLSGKEYVCLRLGCAFGKLDVFAAPGVIAGDVRRGVAVEAYCWTVGHLVGPGMELPFLATHDFWSASGAAG